jgi:hypothetical protein
MKIKNILAATAITAWSGMALAGFVTTFGQSQSTNGLFPLNTYAEARDARNAFVSGLGPGATAISYDFEGATAGAKDPLTIAFGGGVSATLSGTGEVKTNTPSGTDFGRFSVSGVSGSTTQGSQYWATTASNEPTSFLLDFNGAAVQAFGFFATDIGDFGGSLSLQLTLMNGDVLDVSPGDPFPDGEVFGSGPILGLDADGSVLFFGVRAVSTQYFKAVRFISSGGGTADDFGFDMFTIVTAPTGPNPTPLPGSLALVGAALGGLALVRRRR